MASNFTEQVKHLAGDVLTVDLFILRVADDILEEVVFFNFLVFSTAAVVSTLLLFNSKEIREHGNDVRVEFCGELDRQGVKPLLEHRDAGHGERVVLV